MDIDETPAVKFIDGRGEMWKGWVEKFLTYGWTRRQLPAGDFYFRGHGGTSIGVETKTSSDMASRLKDARRELAQLIDQVDIPILLLFGPWQRRSNDTIIGGQDQLTWGHLWNLIQSFQDDGLRVQVCLSRDHAFLRINQLYAYYQKVEHVSTLVPRRSASDRRIACLMPIPGVSRKIGGRLLEHFGSIEAVAGATLEDLKKVPLIGGTKARVIRDFCGRVEPYR